MEIMTSDNRFFRPNCGRPLAVNWMALSARLDENRPSLSDEVIAAYLKTFGLPAPTPRPDTVSPVATDAS